MSRIDNAQLVYKLNTLPGGDDASANDTAVLDVYALNYNVLRLMSGMGGLAYSN